MEASVIAPTVRQKLVVHHSQLASALRRSGGIRPEGIVLVQPVQVHGLVQAPLLVRPATTIMAKAADFA